MVGKEKSNLSKAQTESLVRVLSPGLSKQEQLLLSPTSSTHSSDCSENASTSASICYDQKAIIKFDDNSESTSTDKLDR